MNAAVLLLLGMLFLWLVYTGKARQIGAILTSSSNGR